MQYKEWQLLQSVVVKQVFQIEKGSTKCDRMLLQNRTGITKSDEKILQSVAVIKKCDNDHKVSRNKL